MLSATWTLVTSFSSGGRTERASNFGFQVTARRSDSWDDLTASYSHHGRGRKCWRFTVSFLAAEGREKLYVSFQSLIYVSIVRHDEAGLGDMRRSIAFFICSAVYLWSAQGANALGLVGETAKPQWPCLAVDTGAQVACAPSSSILLSGLSDTVASSNSTCAEGQATEKICFIPENDNTDIFECFQCVSPKYSPQQAVDKNGESTWWQSSAVSSRKQAVTLRLDFPHEYLLTGVQVKFARSRPSAMRIQISDGADSGESLKWKSIAYYADNCSAHYRQTGQVLCRNFSSGMPGSRVLDVPIELSQLVTNKWDLIPRPAKEQLQKLILRRIRIVFDEIADMPMEQLDGLLAVLKSGDNLKSFGHYSVADFKVYGLCYCNGHAEQCNAKTGKMTLFGM